MLNQPAEKYNINNIKERDVKSKNIRDKIIHIIYTSHTFWVVEVTRDCLDCPLNLKELMHVRRKKEKICQKEEEIEFYYGDPSAVQCERTFPQFLLCFIAAKCLFFNAIKRYLGLCYHFKAVIEFHYWSTEDGVIMERNFHSL